MVRHERYKELLREAEQERLVQQVLAGREKRDGFYRPALVWLGCRLVEWGKSLQQRYDNASLAPQLVADRSSR
jgi:hypothetical protein